MFDGRDPILPIVAGDGHAAALAPMPLRLQPTTSTWLLDLVLNEQQSLTAIDRFSREHDAKFLTEQGARYARLLPATPPGPGQQYAFEVDLDRCSGCKACVAACHALNGLDEQEAWRDVGLLIGGSRTAPVIQHVTAACHHCIEPACMIACPVNAYEKNATTGIVKHLDDQCFGCQYCTLACPYDVPKYHAGKGIVRKCDMCSSRLTVGEPPACVQACPHEAITIRLVNREQVIEDAEAAVFLPAAPDPQITLPTTVYKSKRPFPRNLLPADYARVSSQHAHWPLVIMLVLTQLSVGAFIAGLVFERYMSPPIESALRPWHAASALVFGLVALNASLFHLGRPWLAYRAILGLRHSWLSREIVAFGAFAGLATAYATMIVAEGGLAPDVRAQWRLAGAIDVLGWSVAASGVAALACSAMIYVFTQRECWSPSRVGARFCLTAALLGVATMWLSILLAAVTWPPSLLATVVDECGWPLCRSLQAIAAVKLAWEASIFRHLLSPRMTAMRRSALLISGELFTTTIARFALGILGGLLMPALLLSQLGAVSTDAGFVQFSATTALLFVACVAGELLERYLFFAACAAPRMPGGVR